MKYDVKYVSFEVSKPLTDKDVKGFNDKQYRAYWELIWFLYNNNGKTELDFDSLASICNCENVLVFRSKVWPKISKKFKIKNNFVSHKRVTKQLKKSQALIRQAHKAAEARWKKQKQQQCSSNAAAMPNESEAKTKQRERILSSTKTRKKAALFSASLRFNETLWRIIPPRTERDKKSYYNLTKWIEQQIEEEKHEEFLFNTVLELAKTAQKEGKKPIAYFFDLLQRELKYPKKKSKRA